MNSPSPADDQQLLTSWLAVIGMLTMYWSPVERHIDQCVHLLYRHPATPRKGGKPTRLGNKLEFIKSKIPAGIIDAQELDNLTKLTKNTVKIRDIFVHGVLKSYDQEKIEIDKVNGRVDAHVIENFTINRDRLDRSATALSILQQQWSAIASALVNA